MTMSADDAHGRKGRTVTRSDLVDALQRDTGLHREECAAALEQVLGTIIDQLDSNEQVKIARFGTFEVFEKRARTGRNPNTREEVTIEPRRVVRFRPSGQVRGRVAGAPD